MSDIKWWGKAVIYELYVDRWAGNFRRLTERLDYFKWLGVDTLWLLPHYPSPMVDGGYDISDYRNNRPDLGTLDDFDSFVRTAHEKKLKVIVDLVLNHTSDQHPWFKEARSSTNNPKRSWYLWGSDENRWWEATVVFPDIKTKNWIKNSETGDYYYATFYPQQPDLNWDNPEVQAEMLGIIDFWMDRGVDGFRLDAIGRLFKRDHTTCYGLPETHQMLKTIRAHVDRKNPEVVLLAESGGWPQEAKPYFGTGDECQLVMNFPLASELLWKIHGTGDGIANIWSQCLPVPEGCKWAIFTTNHDSLDLWFLGEERGKELVRKFDPQNKYAWQMGQSVAARLGEVCNGEADKIVEATRVLLDQPGVPIIYYGNELGMLNADLDHKPVDTREFVRGQFDWSEVEKQKADPSSVINQVRALIVARNR